MEVQQPLELADWRRAVAELYSDVRGSDDPQAAWRHWRKERDRLFGSHSQSPVPLLERSGFKGLSYFPYEPGLRFALEIVPAKAWTYEVSSSDETRYAFTRFGTASFDSEGRQTTFEVYWLEGYSGGIFLPFADAGAGRSTYGGGRYVLDTAKGADLGTEGSLLIVDFNFAYQPSCSYDPRWVCPLAPAPNRFPFEVPAGEKLAGG